MLIANKISLSFCLLLLLVMPKSALSWGKQGHLIVAMIAYNHLTVPAKKKVDRLIYSLSPKKKPGTGKKKFSKKKQWQSRDSDNTDERTGTSRQEEGEKKETPRQEAKKSPRSTSSSNKGRGGKKQ